MNLEKNVRMRENEGLILLTGNITASWTTSQSTQGSGRNTTSDSLNNSVSSKILDATLTPSTQVTRERFMLSLVFIVNTYLAINVNKSIKKKRPTNKSVSETREKNSPHAHPSRTEQVVSSSWRLPSKNPSSTGPTRTR